MKKIFTICFLFFFPLFFLHAEEQREKAFVVKVFYNQGVVKIENVFTANRFVPEQRPDNEMGETRFWLEIISSEGKVLEKRLFDISTMISAEPPTEGSEYPEGSGGTFELDQVEELIVLSYHSNAKMIFLFDMNRKLIDQKDVSFLTELCGDGVCQSDESIEDCPKDCKEKKNDSIISETKKDSVVKVNDPNRFNMLFTTLIVLGFFVVFVPLIVFSIKNRKGKIEDNDNDSQNNSL